MAYFVLTVIAVSKVGFLDPLWETIRDRLPDAEEDTAFAGAIFGFGLGVTVAVLGTVFWVVWRAKLRVQTVASHARTRRTERHDCERDQMAAMAGTVPTAITPQSQTVS